MKTNNVRPTLARVAAVLSLVGSTLAPSAHGQTFQLLYSFQRQNGLDNWPLVQGSDGNIYALVLSNGTAATPAILSFDSNGNVTNRANFNVPNITHVGPGTFLQATDGSFYFTASHVFRLSPDGTLSTLAAFEGTNSPGWRAQSLIQGKDSNFYGLAPGQESQQVDGGTYYFGTIFKMTASGTLTTLVQFDGANLAIPGGLGFGSDGNLFGIVWLGLPRNGAKNGETVFQVTPDGTVSTLGYFPPLTAYSQPGIDGVILGSDGNLYGVAFPGGDFGLGTLFEVTPAGDSIALLQFDGSNGAHPSGRLVQVRDGSFYGTTWGDGGSGPLSNGTVFRLSTDGVLSTIWSFSGSNGKTPEIGLVQDRDGNLYGTTYSGGAYGAGTIFRLVMPRPPTLSIACRESEIVLSWPTNAVGFSLQSSSDLSSPANWMDSTDTPVVTANLYTVTNTVSGGAQFYRLKK